MEDSHTPMYHFIAPAKDDPYVHIAPVAFVHDFMILHVPLLCYPYAPKGHCSSLLEITVESLLSQGNLFTS